MGRLEHGDAVADVRARRDANATNLGGKGIRQIVAIQVECGDDAVFVGPQQHLLQHRVGDHVFDDDLLAGLRILQFMPGAAVQRRSAELFAGTLVGPILEGTFGELHDVAFVHDRHRSAVLVDRVLQRLPHQALGALDGHRLDADTAMLREPDLAHAHFILQEAQQFHGAFAVRRPLDAGIDVFGVLTKDHHVGKFRMQQWTRHAGKPADRPQTHVEIQLLAQRHIQRPDAAADRRRHRSLDTNDELTDGLQCFFRHPLVFAIDA